MGPVVSLLYACSVMYVASPRFEENTAEFPSQPANVGARGRPTPIRVHFMHEIVVQKKRILLS